MWIQTASELTSASLQSSHSDPQFLQQGDKHVQHTVRTKAVGFQTCCVTFKEVGLSPVTGSSRTSFPPGFKTLAISARLSEPWTDEPSATMQESTQSKVDAGWEAEKKQFHCDFLSKTTAFTITRWVTAWIMLTKTRSLTQQQSLHVLNRHFAISANHGSQLLCILFQGRWCGGLSPNQHDCVSCFNAKLCHDVLYKVKLHWHTDN